MKAAQYFVGIFVLMGLVCSAAALASAPPAWVAGIGALILGRGVIGANPEQDSRFQPHLDGYQSTPNSQQPKNI